MVMTFRLLGAFLGVFALFSALPESTNGQSLSYLTYFLQSLDFSDLFGFNTESCSSGAETCVTQALTAATQLTSLESSAICRIISDYLRCLFNLDGCSLASVSSQINSQINSRLSLFGYSCELLEYVDFQNIPVLSGLIENLDLSGLIYIEEQDCDSGVQACVSNTSVTASQLTSLDTSTVCGISTNALQCLYNIDGCYLDSIASQINEQVKSRLRSIGYSCDRYRYVPPDNGQTSVKMAEKSGMLLLLTLPLLATAYTSCF